MAVVAPGLDLPAEIGRSGSVVRRFGGMSRGKSGRTMGCIGLARGPGELPRDVGCPFRSLEITRPAEAERPVTGARDGAGLLRVGVDGREIDLGTKEFEFAGI